MPAPIHLMPRTPPRVEARLAAGGAAVMGLVAGAFAALGVVELVLGPGLVAMVLAATAGVAERDAQRQDRRLPRAEARFRLRGSGPPGRSER